MKIVIVGGGFGGVKAAIELAKDERNQIVLVSDKSEMQYYPALFATATGHSRRESWIPLGRIFAEIDNVDVRLDTIISINADTNAVLGRSGISYAFDTCILALGAVTTYFGIKGLDTYAYGIKSSDEITRLKQHIYHDICEKHSTDKRYVVVGGGPTGVELAASLGTYIRRMCKHYGVKSSGLKVELIEAAPRVLPRMGIVSSRLVTKRLRSLGVRVSVDKKVESASANDLMVSGDSRDTHTIIWTSGVANHPLFKAHPELFTLAPNGRVVVDTYLRARKNIYVIGDNAATQYTGFAQTALHDAKYVAANIRRLHDRMPLKEYRPKKPVVVVPVGRHWAIVEWHGLRFGGLLGSLLRRLADLLGYLDILPVVGALDIWLAGGTIEDDYYQPSPKRYNKSGAR